jgi:hypothetical protein
MQRIAFLLCSRCVDGAMAGAAERHHVVDRRDVVVPLERRV